MNIRVQLAFCVVAFCTIQRISCACTTDDDDLLVETEQGWVRGAMEDSIVCKEPYYAFKGIPYAKPPVGDLRFKAPEKAEKWNGTRDATEFGEECLHYDPIYKNTSGSEDCLFLNVFTPKVKPASDSLLPVTVHLTGITYESDFEKSIYGPDFFIADDVVVVTLNYRLGALGFLCLDTKEVSGNAAMKDQVLALKWVQKNIKNFGGDPDKIALIGTSAGAAAVAHHIASPMSKGIFKTAVMISGVPSCDPIFPFRVVEKSYLLAKSVGCENNCGLLSCLQKIPITEELLKNEWPLLASELVTNVFWKKMAQFVPVTETDFGQERFMTESTIKAFKYQTVSSKIENIMIGFATHESLLAVTEFADNMIDMYNKYPELMVPNKISYNVTPSTVLDLAKNIHEFYFNKTETISVKNMKEFIDMNSMASLVHHMGRFIDWCSLFINSYVFEFSYRSERNYFGQQGAKYGVNGTSHGDSIFYMYNPKPWNWDLKNGTAVYDMTKKFVNTLTDFVKTGNPTTKTDCDKAWPKYTPDNQNYLKMSENNELKKNPMSEQYKFWERVYNYVDFGTKI